MSTVSKTLNDSFDDKLASANEPADSVQQEDAKKVEEKYKKQIEDLQRVNQTKVSEINKYIEQIEKVKQEKEVQINQLQSDLKLANQKCLDIERMTGTSNLENDNNVKQIQLLEQENERLSKQIKALEQKIVQKDTQYKQILSELDEKQKICQDVVSEDKDIRSKYLSVLDHLQQTEEQNEDLQRKIDELNFKLQQTKKVDDTYLVQIKEFQEKDHEIKQAYTQLEKEYNKALQQIKKQQATLKSYDEEIVQSKITIEQLNSKLHLLQQQEQVYSLELAKLREFNKGVKQDETKQSDLTTIQIQTLQRQVDDLQERLKESQKKIQQQEKELQKPSMPMIGVVTSNEELNKLKDMVKKLQTTEKDLKQQLDTEQTKYTKLKASYDQQQQQLQQIALIKQQLDEAQKTKDKYNQLTRNYSEQQKQLGAVQEEVIKLKCEIGEIFNAAFEFGGPKLVDKIQTAVGMNG